MDEFLRLNWRTKDLSELEPQRCFITEDCVSDSLIYKVLQDKSYFYKRRRKIPIFDDKQFIPGENFKFFTSFKSNLDEWAQEHCLTAMKLLQSGRDHSTFNSNELFSIDILEKLKLKIIEENAKFQTFVKYMWDNSERKALLKIRGSIFLFGKNVWEEKWKRIVNYPKFYKELLTFNMKFDENSAVVDIKCVTNALELGTLARFSHPDLKSFCSLKCVNLPKLQQDHNRYSKLPVSQDANIDEILKTRDVDVVVSSSGLKCLTDTGDYKNKWMIPVVVKKVNMKTPDGSEKTKNVVFLDKPFSQGDISQLDLVYISFKRLIKTNFCHYEAFSFGDEESKFKDRIPEKTEPETNSEGQSTSRLDKHNTHSNTIHHNALYRLWNMKKSDGQCNLMKNRARTVEINVLVRSKIDACECNESGKLQPVILRPKLELQLRHGANVPSKSELAREWCSLFFTPYSNMYRVRLSPTTSEVICVEKCTIQKIMAEAQTHYEFKPHLGLGTLQNVFEELVKLEPGKYLLQHLPKHEAFISVLKECGEGAEAGQPNIFDFHNEYNNVSLSDLPKDWLPIDVNFILPWFDSMKRMPGMYTPRKKEEFKRKGKKKKKNNGAKKAKASNDKEKTGKPLSQKGKNVT